MEYSKAKQQLKVAMAGTERLKQALDLAENARHEVLMAKMEKELDPEIDAELAEINKLLQEAERRTLALTTTWLCTIKV